MTSKDGKQHSLQELEQYIYDLQEGMSLSSVCLRKFTAGWVVSQSGRCSTPSAKMKKGFFTRTLSGLSTMAACLKSWNARGTLKSLLRRSEKSIVLHQFVWSYFRWSLATENDCSSYSDPFVWSVVEFVNCGVMCVCGPEK